MQKYFCCQNGFSYSADVKPIINKTSLELSSKHKYKLMSMLSLCVYYDLYGRNRSSTNDKRKVILGLKITDTEASETCDQCEKSSTILESS